MYGVSAVVAMGDDAGSVPCRYCCSKRCCCSTRSASVSFALPLVGLECCATGGGVAFLVYLLYPSQQAAVTRSKLPPAPMATKSGRDTPLALLTTAETACVSLEINCWG
eukprot:1529902-Prymnesium_polylepis.1